MEQPGPVAILLVTMDNRPYLEPCLASLMRYTLGITSHVYLINNGEPGSCDWAAQHGRSVLEGSADRSWVGALAVGAAASDEPFLLFLNDDTLILPSQPTWLMELAGWMRDPQAGAVGPSSNVVNGAQSIFRADPPLVYRASFLISFCCLVRRSALGAAGGLDPALTDADDLDYSIRLAQAGYTLVGDRGVFVYHHGFVTGRRLHGPSSVAGGYNSREWSARNISRLTAKHGVEAVRAVLAGGTPPPYANRAVQG